MRGLLGLGLEGVSPRFVRKLSALVQVAIVDVHEGYVDFCEPMLSKRAETASNHYSYHPTTNFTEGVDN